MKRKIVLTLFAAAFGLSALGACVACDFGGGNDDGEKPDGTEGLAYSLTEDGLSYAVALPRGTENDWENADIVIPASYQNKPVSEIANRGFEGSGIKSVSLPDSVKRIGSSAFESCAGLRSVSFGNGVTEIESFAFEESGLETLNLPATITKIGAQAFQESGNLTKVTVNGNAAIGNMAFKNCTSLTTAEFLGADSLSLGISVLSGCTALESVTVNAESASFTDTTFMDCSFRTYKATLETILKSDFNGSIRSADPTDIVLLRTEEIPAYVSGGYSFKGVESITLPAELTRCGENAFFAASSIQTVVFEGTVAQWCAIEFENYKANPLSCGAEELVIDGNTVSGKLTLPADVTKVGSYAFYQYTGIRELEILGATEIGQSAFYQNYFLYSATLPEGLLTIGRYAFYECALTEITLPETVESIGENAFYLNRRLARMINLSDLTDDDLKTATGNEAGLSKYFEIVTEPDGSSVEKIGDFVFWVDDSGSYNLMLYAGTQTEITLPADADGNEYSIHPYAFSHFTLEGIAFADTENWVRQSGYNQAVHEDVTDPAHNAELLQTYYYSYEWYRL